MLPNLTPFISRPFAFPSTNNMSEGLTRRRGAGAASSTAPTGSSNAADSSSPPVSRPKSQPISSSAVEGRSKVAYDPRDLNDDDETKGVPRLTLMEEVLLLGLKDKAVR